VDLGPAPLSDTPAAPRDGAADVASFDASWPKDGTTSIADAAEAEAEAALPPLDAAPDRVTSSTCDDNILDGDETDIDCGGSCPPCARGQRCLDHGDCGSGPACDAAHGGCACDAITLTCVFSHCFDAKLDGNETDVDCGGDCAGCGPGKACLTSSDCSDTASGCAAEGGCACDAISLTCVHDSCLDHKRDGAETDVDCGGGTCPGCALGQPCRIDVDCTSSACDGVSLRCVSSTCSDHRQDADETDVDCGGATCGPCNTGQKCKISFDCVSGFCNTGIQHVCL
jgi:hypothetical protein